MYIRPHQVKVDYGLPPINILSNYSFKDESEENSITYTDSQNHSNQHNVDSVFKVELSSSENDDDRVNNYNDHIDNGNNNDNNDQYKNSINENNLGNEFKSVSLTELKNQESSKYDSQNLFDLSTQVQPQYTSDRRTDTNVVQKYIRNIYDKNLKMSEFSDDDLDFTDSTSISEQN